MSLICQLADIAKDMFACIHAKQVMDQTANKRVKPPGRHDGKEGSQMVDGILLAHAIMGPKAEGQKIFLELEVLLSLSREAIWVKCVGICETLWPTITSIIISVYCKALKPHATQSQKVLALLTGARAQQDQ